MSKEQTVIDLLIRREQTIAVAESCTGGLLFHRLTNISGSSKALDFGVNVYSNASKTRLLKIPESLVKKYGAVSEETALLMADNVRKILKSDFGISLTGIAGPSGGTKSKPVGLVFIAVTAKNEKICLECLFTGNRLSVKKKAADQAVKLLLEFLK